MFHWMWSVVVCSRYEFAAEQERTKLRRPLVIETLLFPECMQSIQSTWQQPVCGAAVPRADIHISQYISVAANNCFTGTGQLCF